MIIFGAMIRTLRQPHWRISGIGCHDRPNMPQSPLGPLTWSGPWELAWNHCGRHLQYFSQRQWNSQSGWDGPPPPTPSYMYQCPFMYCGISFDMGMMQPLSLVSASTSIALMPLLDYWQVDEELVLDIFHARGKLTIKGRLSCDQLSLILHLAARAGNKQLYERVLNYFNHLAPFWWHWECAHNFKEFRVHFCNCADLISSQTGCDACRPHFDLCQTSWNPQPTPSATMHLTLIHRKTMKGPTDITYMKCNTSDWKMDQPILTDSPFVDKKDNPSFHHPYTHRSHNDSDEPSIWTLSSIPGLSSKHC